MPFRSAPSMASPTFSPPLKNMNVGMHLTPALAATSFARSTSTLRKRTSPYFSDIFAKWGAMRLHGPHQDAVKSTTATAPAALASAIAASNAVESVASLTAPFLAGAGLGPNLRFIQALMIRVMRNMKIGRAHV